ncbi:MAG TPA: 5-formyltetrahydrofolate cyclo-ligase [Bacilli bacterium]
MGDTVLEDKMKLRKHIEQLRSNMTEQERQVKSTAITAEALNQPYWPKEDVDKAFPFTFLAYMPIKAEVDISPILKYGWQHSCRVVAPKVHMEDKSLSLHVIHSFDDLEPGVWGIPEPKAHTILLMDISQISLVLVPGVAFDQHGGRLGYGGGFYDRFLQRFRQLSKPKPMLLALAYGLQIVPAVPMEEHDFRVDQVITEHGALVDY